MKRSRFAVKSFGTLLAVLLVSQTPMEASAADEGLGDMIFTAGTVATDSHGREWAYLSWMATDASLLMGAQYDIYAKTGDMGSANPFALKGSAVLQSDPNSIAILANRATNLGQDLAVLEDTIDQLFAEAIPDGNLSLGEKIAAVIDGSINDAQMYENLVFVSQANPALALAIGRGFACRINSVGLTTLEIRDHATGEVIGRVALEAGNPTVLPAPVNLASVEEENPTGNLNIRLRWESPDALKRLSLLQFGHNIYRMTKAYAEANNYDSTPPSNNAISGLAEAQAEVVRVNNIPVLTDEDNMTTNTYFFVDDNDGLTGGTPFVDGESFYYFITARDQLGRDGLVSTGLLARACDRVAPSCPSDVQTRTVHDFDVVSGVATQYVEISWAQDTNLVDVANYYVYRHTSMADMQSNAAFDLSNRLSGAIAAVPGINRLFYLDETLTEDDFGKTYWYTVRAEDDGICGSNLSGNSGPAFGLVRDREGPEEAVDATVHIIKRTLVCDYVSTQTVSLPDHNVKLSCDREPRGGPIEWAEFSYIEGTKPSTNVVNLGRYYFGNQARVSISLNMPATEQRTYTFYCQVGIGSFKSNIEPRVHVIEVDQEILWKGIYGQMTVTDDDGPHDPELGDPLIEVDVPSDGAEEYRFYRRVDGGPRTLIGQGDIGDALTILYTDYNSGILNGGEICYYYQFFDVHGNPGPMTLIWCFDVLRQADLPKPVLAAIDPTGTETASPGMEVSWFCPPQGVERFELAVALSQGDFPTTLTSDLRDAAEPGVTNFIDAVVNSETNNYGFGMYLSGRVGSNFGAPDAAEFLINAGINLNVEYVMMVRAVGSNGERGPWSNAELFTWSAVPETGPTVPWPTRGLPPVQEETYHADLKAVYLAAGSQVPDGPRVGIRIGEIEGKNVGEQSQRITILTNGNNPLAYVYENAALPGTDMFPCVLYRYQLPSSVFPSVGGDVAQVSVLMEEIAYGLKGTTPVTWIYDPFVCVVDDGGRLTFGIYLLDTQPVVRGAKYQYLLLKFNENSREMERIIPAGAITIP